MKLRMFVDLVVDQGFPPVLFHEDTNAGAIGDKVKKKT